MIIISQDGYEQINFDNVNRIFINDISLSNISIAVEFTNGQISTIGTYADEEYGKEVFIDLLMDYSGSAVIEMPKDKEVISCKTTGMH
jgi:hypothetical protein